MADSLTHALIDAVYRTPLEPEAWGDVMGLMRQRFPSEAQTFYFLHRDTHRVQPVCLVGVAPAWLENFNALYFASDNPWMRLTDQLHQPGVVRTNERLQHLVRDASALYRSAYYNDWMRPQGFKYTIGNTVFAERDVVANITLLRAPDMQTFSLPEVRAFERLSKHMTRALQVANRLGRPQASPAVVAAFDALPQPVALVDGRRRVHYANEPMESLLRGNRGLMSHHGQLTLADRAMQPLFASWFARVLAVVGAAADPSDSLTVPDGAQGQLVLSAIPMTPSPPGGMPSTPIVLLLAARSAERVPASESTLYRRFGCTRSEARLAYHLAQGHSLRDAARQMGIGYETARDYLKTVFAKLDVHSQAQLVARLWADNAGANAGPLGRPGCR